MCSISNLFSFSCQIFWYFAQIDLFISNMCFIVLGGGAEEVGKLTILVSEIFI